MKQTKNAQKKAGILSVESRDGLSGEHSAKRKPTNEELAVRAKAGECGALAALWEQNRGLLNLMFCGLLANEESRRRMTAAGVTPEDLEQEGYFAIADAVKQYNPDIAAKFTTFLRYPVMQTFFKAIGMRTDRQKGEPLNKAASLDEPLCTEDGDGETRRDIIPDAAAAAAFNAAEERIYTQQLHTALEECLNAIDAKQAAALRGRYYEGQTQRAIAAMLGVSPQRVHHLEYMGLRDMRRKGAQKLEQFRQEIITTRAYHGTGFSAWEHKGSVEERIAELLESKRAL